MRILRLALANYRAIESCDIRFAPTGVTIVEGPNEAGKSSLAEAIDFVFRFLDSSRDQELLATRPKGQDVATGIEVEVESGEYAFVLSKSFHKDRRTELVVSRPRREKLSGREAHERARAILSETLDWHLWQALRIGQGQGLVPPDWRRQVRLSQCLDRAAGQARSGEEAESLFAAVEAEYRRYYTDKTNQPRRGTAEFPGLPESEAALDAADRAVQELEGRLGEIDRDVIACARLDREIRELQSGEPALREASRAHDQRLSRVEDLRTEKERLAREVEHAVARHGLAEKSKSERSRLVANERELTRACVAARSELEGARSRAAATSAEVARAEAELAAARTRADQARERLALARADVQAHDDVLELARLRERRERAAAASAALRDAQAAIASTRVDRASLAKIEALEAAIGRAELLLEQDSPVLRVDALEPTTVVVDGEALALAPPEPAEIRLSEQRVVVVPGLLRFAVVPGRSMRDLDRERAERRAELARACADAGVAAPEAARRALERRHEAERTVAEEKRVLAAELGRDTVEELEGTLAALAGRVARREAQDAGRSEAAPADRASARERLAAAEEAEEPARTALERARKAREDSRLEHEQTRATARFAEERRAELERALAAASAALAEARGLLPDEALDQQVAAAFVQAGEAEAAARRTSALLDAEDPERIRARAEAARAAHAEACERRAAAEQERLKLSVRLATLGDEGLGLKLFEAQAAQLRARGDLERVSRRARAAKTLYETMRARRDAARAAYVAPLREKIERLGCWMGRGFSVEIDDALQIVSRTVDGITIPFDDLSAGAREQLCLIARLASAMIVAEEEGVPVILDDALGHTDAARLEEMAALLSLAARSTQVILLTCAPERYRGLAAAERIRLPK